MDSEPQPRPVLLTPSEQRLAVEVEGWLELGAARRALDKLRPLLESPTARPFARLLQVRALIEMQDYDGALALLPRIELADHDPEWFAVTRAWCLKRTGDLPGAAQCMRELLDRRPRSAIGHYNLGCYLALLGDTARALDAVTIACGLDPAFRNHARDESDLEALRGDARFDELLAPAQPDPDDPDDPDPDDPDGDASQPPPG